MDDDCAPLETTPAGCAEARCLDSGECEYVAVDADNDGFATRRCQSRVTGVFVEPGLDCDDDDDEVNPNAWDGPEGEGLTGACDDGIDNDCSGTVDDGQLSNGATCTCEPGETSVCSLSSTGQPVTFPVLDANDRPVGECKLGSRTCLPNGTWGECDGTVAPSNEICDELDNDCDGDTDEDAVDIRTFYYDADGDLHAPVWHTPVTRCTAPTAAPGECSTVQTSCPADAWATTQIPLDDCDDTNSDIHPGATERCNRVDDDCSRSTGGSATEPSEDADNDGYAPLDAQCTGGPLPKTDCFDSDSRVRPNQTASFTEGYCPVATHPYWCASFRSCMRESDCSGLPTTGIDGAFDFNCDDSEEMYDQYALGSTTGNYEAQCETMSQTACDTLMVPYVSDGECGQQGTFRTCDGHTTTIGGSTVWVCEVGDVTDLVPCR